VRIPTFSRQSTSDSEGDRTAVASGTTTSTTPVRHRTDVPARHDSDEPTLADGKAVDDRDAANRDANVAIADRKVADRKDADRKAAERSVADAPVRDDRKPRASLLATLGLIFSVVGAMLVLSGPLLGYGIGVAVLALVLSLSGISATGSRHIAGKTDALIGMILSLGAIVVGVLALTGSLSWLGTDMHPVTSLRDWLDAQFSNRF
jgi:hypothetical protein